MAEGVLVPLGTRLRVWWEDEEAWFSGTVKAYVEDDDTHLVLYDDGDEQHELLGDASLRWERLEPKKAALTATRSSEALATVSDDEDYAEDDGEGAYSGDEEYLSVVEEAERRAAAAAEAERQAALGPPPPAGPLPAGWAMALDPEGDAYYYNRGTGQNSYDRPAGGGAPPPSAAHAAPVRAPTVADAKEKLATAGAARALQALTIEDPTDGLDDLLSGSPITPERFLADYWESEMLHLPRDDEAPLSSSSVSSSSKARRAEGAFGGLLRLEDLDALLCNAACPASSAELLVFEGLRQTDSYATPYAAFASGASVVVNHTDKVWPPANELCARLGRRFGHAYANLYLTPGDSQTAPPHSDDRDVFVLQLHGEKAWLVWSAEDAGTQSLPYTDEMVGKGAEVLAEAALGEPSLSCTLRPGHLLYIPRGAPHVARTAGLSASPSMHLTIAIPTADLCWSGMATQALAAAAGFNGRTASPRPANSSFEMSYRRALPLGPLPRLPPAPPALGPAFTEFNASSASRAAATSGIRYEAAAGKPFDVAPIPAGPPCTYDLLHAQLCGARHHTRYSPPCACARPWGWRRVAAGSDGGQ